MLTELSRDIESNNVSHAYLFSGPKHLGKMATAYWFAEKLLCENATDAQKEQCHHLIEKLVHPDLLVLDKLYIDGVSDDWDDIAHYSNISQQHRKKSKAKTDSISIEDIRMLQERLHETGIGKRRVCILRSVERMQDAAANAFLKILEEPPEGLVFMLTTQRLSSLLPTITSRSRTIQFRRLPQSQLMPIVENMAPDDIQFILQLSQGAPGIAMNLQHNPDALREEKILHTQAVSILRSKSVRERIKLLKPVYKRGKEADRFLVHLGLAFRTVPTTTSAALSFHALVRGLQTNAHREILLQKFAFSIG